MERLLVVLCGIAVMAVLFIPLELAFAARPQRVLRAHLTLDLIFLAGQYGVWNGLNVAVLASAHHAWHGIAPIRLDSLPSSVQVILAIVLGDLCMYAFHVACHRVPWLWRIHSVHHSATELDWAAAHREHPLDGLLTQLAMNLPALLLGFSFELFAPVIVFRGLWAVLVHSNTRLPLGPLRWVLGDSEFHRYHHCASEHRVRNFANLAPWVDWLFGTHALPCDESYELGVPGLHVGAGMAWKNYLALLLLRRERTSKPTDAQLGSGPTAEPTPRTPLG